MKAKRRRFDPALKARIGLEALKGEWRLDKAQNFFAQSFAAWRMRQRAEDDLAA